MARTYPFATMRAERTGEGHLHVGWIGAPTRVVDGLGDRRQGRDADVAVVDVASPIYQGWTRRQRSCSTSVLTLAGARASGWAASEGIDAGRSPGVITHGTRCITPVISQRDPHCARPGAERCSCVVKGRARLDRTEIGHSW